MQHRLANLYGQCFWGFEQEDLEQGKFRSFFLSVRLNIVLFLEGIQNTITTAFESNQARL